MDTTTAENLEEPQRDQAPELTAKQKQDLLVTIRYDIGEQFAKMVELAVEAYDLTPKEHVVLKHLLDGLETKEMSARLGNTDKTLKHHIASIFHKLDVGSRAELFAFLLGRLS